MESERLVEGIVVDEDGEEGEDVEEMSLDRVNTILQNFQEQMYL